MNGRPEPSENLRMGRRALEGMESVTLMGDLVWDNEEKVWVFPCRLSPKIKSNKFVPSETEWYIHIPNSYPWGEIKFYPAKENGIQYTFPHQLYNSPGPPDQLWRDGNICIDTTVRALNRTAYDTEPFDDNKRLRWRVQRALIWLVKASNGSLVTPGEPYELPDWPYISRSSSVAFLEDTDSFQLWNSNEKKYGYVEFQKMSSEFNLLIIKRFTDKAGNTINDLVWGKLINDMETETEFGVWIKLKDTPVTQPWQAPATWREFLQACKLQEINLYQLLRPVMNKLRDGQRHICLCGFPISEKVGEKPMLMYWQAILLPIVSHGSNYRKVGGYQPNEKGYWARDQWKILRGDNRVDWIRSENWSEKEISNRGRLPSSIRNKKIIIIGVGALGSTIAELLIRGGEKDLFLVDFDILTIGNLVRHTLSLGDVRKEKAKALAKRLNLISPHARVEHYVDFFPFRFRKDNSPLIQGDIIIDTTGSDEVVHNLSEFPWVTEKFFFSTSLGIEANRLFCFAHKGYFFPHEQFHKYIDPWLRRQMEELKEAGKELPLEFIGCWHPIFPARADDIWLLASIAVKHLSAIYPSLPTNIDFVVFEQVVDEYGFAGIRKVQSG